MGGFRTTSPTPMFEAVWPLWAGQPLPGWRFDERFCRNLSRPRGSWLGCRDEPRWQAIQFLPLVFFQLVGILVSGDLAWTAREIASPRETETARWSSRPAASRPSDLGVDQQQEGRGDCQERQDAEAQANRA